MILSFPITSTVPLRLSLRPSNSSLYSFVTQTWGFYSAPCSEAPRIIGTSHLPVRPSTETATVSGAYALMSTVASNRLWNFKNCAGMILCAFNDELVDDLGFDPHHMTMHVPTAALVETNMEPLAIFSLLYENRDRTPRRLDDEQDARDYYDNVNCLAQLTVGIIYLAKIISVVIPLAVCNPGAGLAIPKHEFHNLGGRADGRTDIFRTYLDGFVYNRELSALSDSSCGRIFSPQGFAEIITVEHNGTVGL
ncbi:hypothetical protein R3P38DRAFT_3053540, partial [Favolaschia claudopus]